jgi:hypothetical protein
LGGGIGFVRLRARDLGQPLVDRRLIGRLLDHEQQVAGLDLLALLEQSLLQEAGHAGPQLDFVDRLDPADELVLVGDVAGFDRGHGDRRRRRGRGSRGLLLPAAGEEQKRRGYRRGRRGRTRPAPPHRRAQRAIVHHTTPHLARTGQHSGGPEARPES